MLPADLEFPVCRNCGAQWMNDQQLDALSDSLELQRVARLASLQVMKLHPEAIIPEYKTSGSSGLDLHARLDSPVLLCPKERHLIRTGLAFAIPTGFEGQVRPRSGMALNVGVTCINSPGTIDSDYRGEVGAILINLGQENAIIRSGDRIAQFVICPIMVARLVEVDRLNDMLRGTGGFGSTGR
jgi:dUTP pyrophosphatase